jgi:hypothetical protein
LERNSAYFSHLEVEEEDEEEEEEEEVSSGFDEEPRN